MRVGIAKPRNPCHENRMASFSLTLRAHTADTHPTAIFIHNGAPQALVGSQARDRRRKAKRKGASFMGLPDVDDDRARALLPGGPVQGLALDRRHERRMAAGVSQALGLVTRRLLAGGPTFGLRSFACEESFPLRLRLGDVQGTVQEQRYKAGRQPGTFQDAPKRLFDIGSCR
jgi:hypothetical protein